MPHILIAIVQQGSEILHFKTSECPVSTPIYFRITTLLALHCLGQIDAQVAANTCAQLRAHEASHAFDSGVVIFAARHAQKIRIV